MVIDPVPSVSCISRFMKIPMPKKYCQAERYLPPSNSLRIGFLVTQHLAANFIPLEFLEFLYMFVENGNFRCIINVLTASLQIAINVKNNRNLFVLTYALLSALGAISLFLYGFFPLKYNDNTLATTDDIPGHVGLVRVKTEELYKPIVKKIVIMVIDALRWDFITGPIGIASMPITNSLIKNGPSCLMQAKVNPPTVTMPRIKAMMTGAVPGFIDVALNLGDLPVAGDNLLSQAKNQGHTLNFYGDDTWLKIFPHIFDRKDGTTSFFVSDFTEVDNNVTRHVAEELKKKDDWSILILHYLGLDHIGHFAGPFSPLIKPKLREMDNIIGQIAREIQNWNDNETPAMLVVCGDHGMKNSGGHGGSTSEETLVPFLTIGATSCPSKFNSPNRMSQVDIAPTLSVMLGLPIPLSNIGSIPLHLLNGLPDSTKLFVLYYNSQMVFKQFEKLLGHKSSRAYNYYHDAVRLHVDWLTNQKESHNVKDALILYDKSLQNMKEELVHSMIDYDLHTMTAAMIFMVQIVHILLNGEAYTSATIMKKIIWFTGSLFSYLILRFLWEPELRLSGVLNVSGIKMMLIGFGIALNSYFCANIRWTVDVKDRLWNYSLQEWIILTALIAHIISLASTSFVEEEHQTWYFFWTTLLILLLWDTTKEGCNLQVGVKILLALLGHRLLRKLNSTGNKFAHLPDIANWLGKQDNNTATTTLLVTALGLSVLFAYLSEEKKHRNKTLIFHIAAAVCIYLRHTANEAVAKLPFYSNSRGITEVRIFWIIIILYSLYWICRFIWTSDRHFFTRTLLRFTIQLWVMISAILHRPHNVVLLPMQLITSYIVECALRHREFGKDASIYVYIFLGNVFYFYQGNSNSLATIDIAAGYIGMESYKPFVTGIFLVINTYSAPVLAYMTAVYCSMLHENSYSYPETILSINRSYALWRFLPVAVYTLIVTLQRFHLFVWTVFSPKLLYEAMYCAVMFSLMLTLQLLGVFCKNKR